MAWAQTQERGARLGVVAEDGKRIELYEGSYALLIGVSKYKHGWRSLPGAAKDIISVAEALRRHGFQVTFLNDPTYSELDQTVKQFIADSGQAEHNRLLIYFAGHGHTLRVWNDTSKMGYLVPSDAPLPDDEPGALRERVVGMDATLLPVRSGVGAFKAKAMSMSRMQEYAEEIESKHALFIFDSCFAGSIFSTPRGGKVPYLITSKVAEPVRQFITSGNAAQTVPDESIFRAELVDALSGEADLNHDGYITGSELASFLEDKVTNYSKGTQTPQYGKIVNRLLDKGDFIFVVPHPMEETAPKRSRRATELRGPARATFAVAAGANSFTPAAGGGATQAGSGAAPQPGGDDSRLGVGRKAVRKLSQDERHTYSVLLEAGQYMRVAVEQLGLDVLVVVTGPDGKRVAEVNALGGKSGTETLAVLAAATGQYRVDVVPAADGAPPGEYQIEVAEIRAATPREVSLAEADRLSERVKALYLSGEYERARPLAERVLAAREKELPANDPKIADAYTALGLLAFESGDFGKALSFLGRALNINLAALGEGNPAVASSYEQLGAVYETTSNYGQAEAAYYAALRIRTAAGADDSALATLLNRIGVILDAKGQYTEAVIYHRRALSLFEKAAGPQSLDVVTSYSNLASALQSLGEYRQAKELYTRALAIGEKALGPQHHFVARLLHNIGALSSAMGEHALAVAYLQRALAINEKTYGPDSIYVARSLDNLGAAYREMKEYERAKPLLQRALTIRESAAGQNRLEIAISLQNLGALYQQQGELAKAEPLLTRALAIRSEALGQTHPDVAWTLVSLGSLEQSKQRPDKAFEYYNRALLIQQGAGDRRGQVQTLNHLGEVYESIGDKSRAQEAFTQSRRLSMEQNESPSPGKNISAGTTRSVRITYPSENGASIGKTLTVRGVASLPPTEHLWVLATRADFEGRWWPLGQAEVDAVTGSWEKEVPLGAAGGLGQEFDIAAIIVDDTTHAALADYLKRAMSSINVTPIQLPPAKSSSFVRRVRRAGF
jgi:tetratricopeptide (TPR) repeat protein